MLLANGCIKQRSSNASSPSITCSLPEMVGVSKTVTTFAMVAYYLQGNLMPKQLQQ